MKLFLIRHGETVDNVRGVYAGITDSALTNHGVLQANRLGKYLSDRGVKVAHIFSSDLQRAFKTAEAVRLAQTGHDPGPPETTQLIDLREQDFGYYEGKAFYERSKDSNKSGKESHLEAHRNEPGFVDVESKASMMMRSDRFIQEHLLPLLETTGDADSIVIVAHGIILSQLWRCILRRFQANRISVAPGAVASDRQLILEHLGGWSNTGFLELGINKVPGSASATLPLKRKRSESPAEDVTSRPVISSAAVGHEAIVNPGQSSVTAAAATVSDLHRDVVHMIPDMTLVVRAVNGQDHLRGLKKTRGGIGSLKHDEGQKTIESFFKKRKSN